MEINSQEKDRMWLNETFLTSEEAAAFLGISKQALLSLAKRHKIPSCKKGKMMLFHRIDLELRREKQTALRDKYRPYDK
ncbi:helix-turn-helix domain-containing protein [Listeria aquatica]|uniref:helix-turn-helix domain-containing protein n=1 Tax=Listeria aquatica TaxID=1494960 RepID=UPI003CFD91FB